MSALRLSRHVRADLNPNNRVITSNLEQPIEDDAPEHSIPSVQCPSPSCINIPTAGPTPRSPANRAAKRPMIVRTRIRSPAM